MDLGFPTHEAARVLKAALAEDVGAGDITTLCVVPKGKRTLARLIAKEDLILAGLPGFVMTFELLDPKAQFEWVHHFADGDAVAKGETILTVEGDAGTLLTGERTALNLLGHLSGIATATRRWSQKLNGTRAKLIDTRKTAPGLRALEKYAVRAGGGANHRFGLFDGILIKENHIRAAGGIAKAVASAKERAPHTLRIEVEVTDLAELKEAIDAGADAILLDNMGDDLIAQAVKIGGGRVILEASGNMNEARLPRVAATGVDLISAGSLTHSVKSADLSLLFELL